MAYRQGEPILATDLNTFQTDLNAVYDVGFGDSGYGQVDFAGATPVPSVVVGELIKSTEWTLFRNAAQLCSDHQGSTTTFPPASELAVGEIVEAHEADDGNTYDIDGSLIVITLNRLQVDAGSVTIFSNALNSVRNTSWKNQLQHRFTATWATVDEARYFWNSGGEIRIRASRSGGSATPQNLSWTDMFINMGTIVISHTLTQQFGGGPGWTMTGSMLGYYDFTTSFQEIARGVPFDGGPYGGYGGAYGGYGGLNNCTIEARMTDGPTGGNGDNGRVMEFRILYTDGSANPFSDNVDGTITSDIDYRKATSPLTIPTPVFASSVLLTAGT